MSHIVLILGCHRSGTSLVANALPCLGASLGPRAAWGGRDNPNFGEDLDVLALDERIMMAFGRSWDDPVPMPPNFQNHQMIEYTFGAQALGLLADRLTAHPLFGLKEPRLCRLLPFWRLIFAQVGCKVSVVFVVRHPLAVAASLKARNGIAVEHGLALWLAYVTEARASVDPAWRSCTVLYDEVVMFPHSAVQDIGSALGLMPNLTETRRFAQEFVNNSLRHEEADEEAELPPEVAVVWQMERAKAKQGVRA